MKKIIVAIDGYSSCGKSTIAKQLAQEVGYTYVDTGAMYRAVALYVYRSGKTENERLDIEWIKTILPAIHITFCHTPQGQHVCLNGEDVEKQIRTLEIGNLASQISTLGVVRRYLVEEQQAMGKEKGIVMDGRDIGTVVFPKAELKIFLNASVDIRAQRRFEELRLKGLEPIYEDVKADVEERDYRDTHRQESPLRQAPDAIMIDNSQMTPEEQLEMVKNLFYSRAEC